MRILRIYTNKKNRNKQHFMYLDTQHFSIVQITKKVYDILRFNLIGKGYTVTETKDDCETVE